MTTDLDTSLHRAADSLHRSVENLPLEAAPRPTGRSPVVLGVVLLLVAATTTAIVGATRGNDSGIDVAADPVADVQALVASELPEGFEVAWAGEQAAAVDAAAGAAVNEDGAAAGALVEGQAMGLDTYIYGAATVTDDGAAVTASAYPFATSDLVVNVWDATELAGDVTADAAGALHSLDGLAGTVEATVRGKTGLVCAPPSCTVTGDTDVTTVWWDETDDLEVVLASRSLTLDQILAIAEGLTIEAEDVVLGTLPAVLPGPLEEVGRLHDTAVATTRDAVAQWVGYIDPLNAASRYVDVTTLAGSAAELMALVWELGADQQISVRGVDAWLSVSDSGVAASAAGADASASLPQIDLVWQEASGVLVHVTSLGVVQDDVLGLVESLQVADDDEWLDVMAEVTAATGADAQAQAGAAGADVEVDAGAASAGVGTEDGVEVDANVDAGVADVDAGVSGSGVDAQVNVDAGVAEVEAGLHADLGTEAVIGAVTNTAQQTAAAVAQAQAQLEANAREAAENNPLLP